MVNRFRGHGKVEIAILNDFNILPSKMKEITKNFINIESWSLSNIKIRIGGVVHNFSRISKRKTGFYKLKVYFAKNRFD